MSARFCSFCGKPLPTVGTFCPFCGAARPDVALAPPSAAPPPATYGPLPELGLPSPAAPAVDRVALNRVQLAAIMGLTGAAFSIVATSVGYLVQPAPISTASGLTFLFPWFEFVLLGAVTALALVEILLFRWAFRGLSRLDRTFLTPASLTLLALGGLLGTLVALALVIYAGLNFAPCSSSSLSPGAPVCGPSPLFWVGFALAGAAAIVLLVGYVGMLVGVWRLGKRYNDGRFRFGAILLLLPFLGVAGAVLILLGARNALREAESPGFFSRA